MSKSGIESKQLRIYLKPGQIIGCVGYTDLKISDDGLSYSLHSTEGAELEFYDEAADKHHAICFDTEGTKETNANYMKMYYLK